MNRPPQTDLPRKGVYLRILNLELDSKNLSLR
jgi:hypothetical protein